MELLQKIKNGFYSIKNFIKKHPVILSAIIGLGTGLAIIFSGGTFLVVPAAMSTIVIAGATTGVAYTFAIGLCAYIAMKFSYVTQPLALTLSFLAAICTSALVGVAILSNPLAGLIFCGIGIATLTSGISAFVGYCIELNYKNKEINKMKKSKQRKVTFQDAIIEIAPQTNEAPQVSSPITTCLSPQEETKQEADVKLSDTKRITSPSTISTYKKPFTPKLFTPKLFTILEHNERSTSPEIKAPMPERKVPTGFYSQ